MKTAVYKIDRNIPFPCRFMRKSDDMEYPLTEMKVGDSFLVPFTKSRPCSKNINVPYTKAKLMGMEVSCRTETKGVRIWRIK
jgi:hypothetical protein